MRSLANIITHVTIAIFNFRKRQKNDVEKQIAISLLQRNRAGSKVLEGTSHTSLLITDDAKLGVILKFPS